MNPFEIVLAVLAGVGVLLLLLTFFTVEQQTAAVVQRFGKTVRVVVQPKQSHAHERKYEGCSGGICVFGRFGLERRALHAHGRCASDCCPTTARDSRGSGVRLRFMSGRRRLRCRPCGLLQGVRKFVGEQALAACRVRRVLASIENDVPPEGQRTRRLARGDSMG